MTSGHRALGLGAKVLTRKATTTAPATGTTMIQSPQGDAGVWRLASYSKRAGRESTDCGWRRSWPEHHRPVTGDEPDGHEEAMITHQAAEPAPSSHGSAPAEQLPGDGDHAVRLEAELLLQLLERSRGAERRHADNAPRRADVALPPKVEACSMATRASRRAAKRRHGTPESGARRCPRTASRPRGSECRRHEPLVGLRGQAQLAARRDEDHLRLPPGASAKT